MEHMTLASRFKRMCFICWRMLTSIRHHTSAYVSIEHVFHVSLSCSEMIPDQCWRMLAYADVCWQWNDSGTHQVQDAGCSGLSYLILPYMCPHTAIYVSSYCYICVLILLKWFRTLSRRVLLRSLLPTCVGILLYMCPHTAIYVPSSRRLLLNSLLANLRSNLISNLIANLCCWGLYYLI